MVNETISHDIQAFIDKYLNPTQSRNERLLIAGLIVERLAIKLMAQLADGRLTLQDMYSQPPKGPGGPHLEFRLELLIEFARVASDNGELAELALTRQAKLTQQA